MPSVAHAPNKNMKHKKKKNAQKNNNETLLGRNINIHSRPHLHTHSLFHNNINIVIKGNVINYQGKLTKCLRATTLYFADKTFTFSILWNFNNFRPRSLTHTHPRSLDILFSFSRRELFQKLWLVAPWSKRIAISKNLFVYFLRNSMQISFPRKLTENRCFTLNDHFVSCMCVGGYVQCRLCDIENKLDIM